MSKKKILSFLRVGVFLALLQGIAVVLNPEHPIHLVMFAGMVLEAVALYVAYVLQVARDAGPDFEKPAWARAAMRVAGQMPVEVRVRLAEQGWELHEEDGEASLWVRR